MSDIDVLVQTINLTKIYGDGAEIRALDDVNITIRRGEFVTVMGPSGSGKSTLLNMIGALDRPTSGRVLVAGQDLAEVKDVDHFRARTVGFVFQLHNLLPTLTALENVEVPMYGQPLSVRKRRGRAKMLLELVGLAGRMDHLPSELSGGERQRVAIARALANDPALILADEPTGNLDTAAGDEIMHLLAELNTRQGTTIVVVTHSRRVARASRRILTMQDGRIVDDHQVADPLTEDLRELALSQLGRDLLKGNLDALSQVGLVRDGQLTPEAERLRDLLEQTIVRQRQHTADSRQSAASDE
ncbi:MAG TPA: ABC transporter ATP-binding protein [Anaerolineae bacterium]|nr:ABC transporter ATP-binding protein [Anaerolineae bacterium]HIQ06079.1 ABC transporter ATP-binding protein [Anaerolineae bacterium]